MKTTKMMSKVLTIGMLGLVLAFGLVSVGCVSTGISAPKADKFSGITKQVATLGTDGIYRWVRIQKASKVGSPDVYMIFARNNDAGKRYLELSLDGEYIEVPEDGADFDVSSSQYGVATFRNGSFVLTPVLREKMLNATNISVRYQQNLPVFVNKILIDQLHEFLK